MFLLFLIEYIIMAIVCYFGFNKTELAFYKNGQEIELSEKSKKAYIIIMSILWIIYVPILVINWFRER